MKTRIFISYSRNSEEQDKRILSISDRLNLLGLDCYLDQYEHQMVMGWPRWMNDQIHMSNYILVFCTKSYHSKVTNLQTTKNGKGVKFESLLTLQDLYESNSVNEKYIPVLFDSKDSKYIPKPLRPFHYYVLDSEEGFEKLYRRLTNQPKIVKPISKDIALLQTGENITINSDENNNDQKNMGSSVDTLVSQREIELRIEEDFDSYTEEEQNKLMNAIRELLGTKRHIKIKRKERGSVKLTLELAPDECEKLLWAVKSGELNKFNVVDAAINDIGESPMKKSNYMERHFKGKSFKHGRKTTPEIKLLSKSSEQNKEVVEDSDEIKGLLQHLKGEKNYPKVKIHTMLQSGLVVGIVVSLQKKVAVINIGYKSDGVVPLSEFKDMPDLKVGDEVEVFVVERENAKGELILSRKIAKAERAWENIVNSYKSLEVVSGSIIDKTQEGWIVDLFGLETLLPTSQVDGQFVTEYKSYIGKILQFKVINIDENTKHADVSIVTVLNKNLLEPLQPS